MFSILGFLNWNLLQLTLISISKSHFVISKIFLLDNKPAEATAKDRWRGGKDIAGSCKNLDICKLLSSWPEIYNYKLEVLQDAISFEILQLQTQSP